MGLLIQWSRGNRLNDHGRLKFVVIREPSFGRVRRPRSL